MRPIFLTAALIAGSAAFSQEKTLLVGTYTRGASEGIYVYSMNDSTGALTKISSIASENPSYLALSNDNKHVYAVNENGDGKGAVSAYNFTDGKLSLVNTQPSHGDAPCYIALDKTNKWAVVANYTGGNFSVYPVADDGSLGEAVQTIQHAGTGANKDRQEKPHVHAAVFSPDQKYLAVVDLGTDKISMYPFNAGSAKPVTEKPNVTKSAGGAGPRHILFNKGGDYAYVLEELSGFVSVYRCRNGKLLQVQRVNAHKKGFKGDIGSAAIKMSADGKFLYASNRGDANTIAIFSIAGDGKLQFIGSQATGGKAPRDFSISPGGNFVLSTNSSSGNIAVFSRNQTTGQLTPAGAPVAVPDPVCLLFVP